MPISFTNLRDGIISVPEDCLRSEEESEAEQKSVIVNVGKTVKKKSPKKTPKPTPVVTPTPKPTKKPLQSMQPTNQTPATAHPRQGLYAEEEDVQISSVKFDKAVQCYGKYGILHGDRRVLQSG